jgi:HD-GYP domain-containing protein (c-di-GMP phosphodiesterase class II)
MTRSLQLYIAGLVVISTVLLITTSSAFGADPAIAINFMGDEAVSQPEIVLGIVFWIVVTLFASALPVRMPRGMLVAVSIAPVLAALSLGGPAVGTWVALIGTTEVREIRGRIPWYGTVANHAGMIPPAVGAGLVIAAVGHGSLLIELVGIMLGAIVLLVLNLLVVSGLLTIRTGQPLRQLLLTDPRNFAASLIALAPLAWLMAQMYTLAWWASLLFALPLYTTRLAYHNFIEMREMFTQTITALAGAVDKRDPYTSKHSWRVKEIGGDIGRAMHLTDSELEALEWGGLLHDVGKIGVPDNVLLKQERLNREERMIMNAHPVLGAQIIAPVTRLSRELPIIRHHHEWYNGSGYPDRLIGDEIPLLARVLHVADAFEAMTAQRPYRMTPLTAEQALGELRKFAGIQFDPKVVDAFVRTQWVEDVQDPGRTVQPRPIPLISQHANRVVTASPVASGSVDPH